MAANVLVDAGFLVALLSRRDHHHKWAAAQAQRVPPPWATCESVLSEGFHLLGSRGYSALAAMLQRKAVTTTFDLRAEIGRVLELMHKYRNIPMSLADASLVRMSEILAAPLLMTTDEDFRVYRRHGRQVVPVSMP